MRVVARSRSANMLDKLMSTRRSCPTGSSKKVCVGLELSVELLGRCSEGSACVCVMSGCVQSLRDMFLSLLSSC